MKTAHLGRRLGDWLGIVPEDDVPVATAVDYFDLHQLEHLERNARTATAAVGEPEIIDAASRVTSSPVLPRLEPTAAPGSPAPSPVRSSGPDPEPAKNVRSFRDVVNQRRAETQRRASPQAPPRW